ncbi:N-acetylmuramoyl-L-alanine amidase [Sphingobacteriaceae bacterium WQ 2009]|uniref:N-acetylmuramoyl-L-alanine amidase n=1 Tax=Rhinopithecimicrobium faecis TaxID=2820698 RepID=A0A8T4H7D1_9SPHI|nr:N-acetylmuramoyl-L-alanine amidase [Sphingobacteriaceae bacterium WQ 2009]
MNLRLATLALCTSSLIAACTAPKYAATEKIYKKKAKTFASIYEQTPPTDQVVAKLNDKNTAWIASTNFGIRKPNYVIIHHTAQDSLGQTIKTFHNEKVGVSSHYVIGRDGKIVQMVNDYYRAHHAGIGKWGNDKDLNSSSIGIELDNNGTTDPWTEAQITSLLKVLNYLKKTYNIPQANFIGHMDIAPTRKNDPARFPWKTLADQGFGYWYDLKLETPPADFNAAMALRVIGYDISNLEAAVKGFKRHFIQTNDRGTFSSEELKIVYAIFKKYL